MVVVDTRKHLKWAAAIAAVLVANVAFANHYADEADQFFQKTCSKKKLEGIKAFVCDLRERLDNIQLVPGPQGPQGPKGDKGDPGEQGPLGTASLDCIVRQHMQTDEQVLQSCYQNTPHLERENACATRVFCENDEIATGGSCYYRPIYPEAVDSINGQDLALASRPIADESGQPIGWQCFMKNFFANGNEPPTAFAVCCKKPTD